MSRDRGVATPWSATGRGVVASAPLSLASAPLSLKGDVYDHEPLLWEASGCHGLHDES